MEHRAKNVIDVRDALNKVPTTSENAQSRQFAIEMLEQSRNRGLSLGLSKQEAEEYVQVQRAAIDQMFGDLSRET